MWSSACQWQAAVAGDAVVVADELGVAPAADPAEVLGEEADPFEVGVADLLAAGRPPVVDREAPPGPAAVGRLEDGAGDEVLERDEADPVVEEEDLPAPLAAVGELDARGPVLPVAAAVGGVEDDRLEPGILGEALVGGGDGRRAPLVHLAADDPAPVGVDEVDVDEVRGVRGHVDQGPGLAPVGGLDDPRADVGRVVLAGGVDHRPVDDGDAAEALGGPLGEVLHRLPVAAAVGGVVEERPDVAPRAGGDVPDQGAEPADLGVRECDAPEIGAEVGAGGHGELLLPGVAPVVGPHDLSVAVDQPAGRGVEEPDVIGARARLGRVGLDPAMLAVAGRPLGLSGPGGAGHRRDRRAGRDGAEELPASHVLTPSEMEARHSRRGGRVRRRADVCPCRVTGRRPGRSAPRRADGPVPVTVPPWPSVSKSKDSPRDASTGRHVRDRPGSPPDRPGRCVPRGSLCPGGAAPTEPSGRRTPAAPGPCPAAPTRSSISYFSMPRVLVKQK